MLRCGGHYSRNISVPGQRATVLIFDDPGLEEIPLLLEIHRLRHPLKGIFRLREGRVARQAATDMAMGNKKGAVEGLEQLNSFVKISVLLTSQTTIRKSLWPPRHRLICAPTIGQRF